MHSYSIKGKLSLNVAACGSRLIADFGGDRVWIDAAGRAERRPGHAQPLCWIGGDDERVATGGAGECRVWWPRTGAEKTARCTSTGHAAALVANSLYFLDEAGLCVWDVQTDARAVVAGAKIYRDSQQGGSLLARDHSVVLVVSDSPVRSENHVRVIDPAFESSQSAEPVRR